MYIIFVCMYESECVRVCIESVSVLVCEDVYRECECVYRECVKYVYRESVCEGVYRECECVRVCIQSK